MVICCDTSFLFSLYGNDANSPRAVAWIARCRAPLHVNTLTEYEFGNALRFAEFRGALRPGDAARYSALFEAAIAHGRLVVEACNLADVVDEAKRLSATYTVVRGHRGFDILHVAAALVLGAKEFLTFDRNQKLLTEAEGMLAPL